MSHYATVKCTLSGTAEDIVNALGRCGYSKQMVEVHATRQHLVGYHGDTRAESAHVIVRRKFVGGASNDIGFERKADGTWTMHISDFDKHKHNEEWQNRLRAYNAVGKAIGWAGASKWTEREETKEGKRYVYVEITR